MSTADSDLPPLVFIHGWKASILASKSTGKVQFDYTFDRLLGVTAGDVLELPMQWDSDGRQTRDDLEASHPTYDVKGLCGMLTLAQLYGPILKHLRKEGRDVKEFAYDWRRDLDETSLSFEAFLEAVKDDTGKEPQVMGHSMGCLVTLHVLNRNPGLFHSVLFGAGAMGPNFSLMEDFSLVGNMNKIVMNNKMFTPSQQLTNPGAHHMLIAKPEERLQFGKKHTVVLSDATGKPVDVDVGSIEFWRRHKFGMYHPSSGVEVTPAKERWLESVLERCSKFRKALIPKHPASEYPPVAVLNSDGFPTNFKLNLDKDGHVHFDAISTLPGDGRVVYEDSLPPKGIPVSKTITNKRDHSEVLNDVEAVDTLLAHLLSVRGVDSK